MTAAAMAPAAPSMLTPKRAPLLDGAGVYDGFGGVYPPVGLTQKVEVEVQLLPIGYGAPELFGGGTFPVVCGLGGAEPLAGGAELLAGGGGGSDGAELLEAGEQTPEVSGLIPN